MKKYSLILVFTAFFLSTVCSVANALVPGLEFGTVTEVSTFEELAKYNQVLSTSPHGIRIVGDITVTSNISLTGNQYVIVPSGSTLRIAKDHWITVSRNSYRVRSPKDGGTFVCGVNVLEGGTLILDGNINGYGQFYLAHGAKVKVKAGVFTDSGVTITNENMITVASTGANPSQNGMQPGYYSSGATHVRQSYVYADDMATLKKFASGDGPAVEVRVYDSVTLDENISLPKNKKIRSGLLASWKEQGAQPEIIVPSGLSLTIDGEATFHQDSRLVVNGTMTGKGSVTLNTGAIVSAPGIFRDGGYSVTYAGPITVADAKKSIPSANGLLSGTYTASSGTFARISNSAGDMTTLRSTLNDSKVSSINVVADIDITDSVTIPDSKTLMIVEGNTLRVPSGSSLTVNGTLNVDAGCLDVVGRITGSGVIKLVHNAHRSSSRIRVPHGTLIDAGTTITDTGFIEIGDHALLSGNYLGDSTGHFYKGKATGSIPVAFISTNISGVNAIEDGEARNEMPDDMTMPGNSIYVGTARIYLDIRGHEDDPLTITISLAEARPFSSLKAGAEDVFVMIKSNRSNDYQRFAATVDSKKNIRFTVGNAGDFFPDNDVIVCRSGIYSGTISGSDISITPSTVKLNGVGDCVRDRPDDLPSEQGKARTYYGTIKMDIDHSAVDQDTPVTFTVIVPDFFKISANMDGLKALFKAHDDLGISETNYTEIDASSPANNQVRFTIPEVGRCFTENDIIITRVTNTSTPHRNTNGDGSGGGCSTGVGMIALVAIGLALMERKK